MAFGTKSAFTKAWNATIQIARASVMIARQRIIAMMTMGSMMAKARKMRVVVPCPGQCRNGWIVKKGIQVRCKACNGVGHLVVERYVFR